MFKYFGGPQKDMHALSEDEKKCSLCGAVGLCFHLEDALCTELQDQKEFAFGCVSCLRKGRFEFWHDTEIGVLDEYGLKQVYNHNKPAPAEFPASALIELRRTPRLVTWQQELWLTHCNDFMAYVGTWEPKDFYANAPDGDCQALFHDMTDEWYQHLWEESQKVDTAQLQSWHATYYTFRCLHCRKLRGNWDCD